MLGEAGILNRIRSGQLTLAPLELAVLDVDPRRAEGLRACLRLEAGWQRKKYRFDVEVRRVCTPKNFAEALRTLRELRDGPDPTRPMLVVPYLSDDRIAELAKEGISGIDLSGNGIVVVPGELLACRTGQPNRFPASAPIKNIFRGTSSLVSRVFLLRPRFGSVTAVRQEIRRRGGSVSLSTVSKVLKALAQEVLVEHNSDGIRLLQADKLLDALADNYKPPNKTGGFVARSARPTGELLDVLADAMTAHDVQWAVTGMCSAGKYAVTAAEEKLSLYVSVMPQELADKLRDLCVPEGEGPPNFEVFQTPRKSAYFDVRWEGPRPWASPVQTYLELACRNGRNRQAAAEVRQVILRGLRGFEGVL